MRIKINGHVNTLPGSNRNAQGHIVKDVNDIRRTAANVIKKLLFPSNGTYHQAKRRGERALALA